LIARQISVVSSAVFIIQDVVIQTEDEIRVKIVGTRVDATDIVSELISVGF